jgi:hypothetical protein
MRCGGAIRERTGGGVGKGGNGVAGETARGEIARMKRLICAGLWLAAGATMSAATARGAEESFSKAVRPEDFSATGLNKLTAEELARLDALVRDFKSGTLDPSSLRSDAVRAETRAVKAEKKAATAEARKEPAAPGLIAKAKVMLTPGTQVEYDSVESRIAGDFRGWEGRTVFTLENGQRWQVANGGTYYTPPIASPKVKIAPASLGGFWMTIEGVGQRVKVAPLAAK